MKKKILIASASLLILFGIILWPTPSKQHTAKDLESSAGSSAASHYKSSTKNLSSGSKANKKQGAVPGIKLFDQSTALLANDPKEALPNAKSFDNDNQSEAAAIGFLADLLDDYRVIAKSGGYPIGLNVEITNALLGDNPKKVALISRDHSRINNDGELVDQWGVPYFFHSNSLTNMDIRSAGEDLTMYTEDDIVLEDR